MTALFLDTSYIIALEKTAEKVYSPYHQFLCFQRNRNIFGSARKVMLEID